MSSVSPTPSRHPLARALAWIERHRAEFALPAGPITEATLRALKPLGEMVLIAEKLVQRDRAHAARSRRLLAWAWDELGQGDVLLHILAAKPDLIVLSTVYASFAQCGFANERLAYAIGQIHDLPASRAIEFPKWRRLDVCHAMASLRGERMADDALEGSWLAHRPEPWLLGEDAAYAVTHEIFYATDYGRHPRGVPTELRDYLELWLPAWLRIYERRNNFDLFAELLMSAAYLGLESIYREHLPRLLSEQAQDGSFPGPAGSAATQITAATPDRRANFLRNYHTTLVGMLALDAG
ncbi:MAG TPA: hypothetical protein VFZ91_06020 [Allosphingosinicella sp.]